MPGILRADPRLVPEAEQLPLVGRADAEALARHGASVLHPAALEPAEGTRLAIWLRDVRDPDGPGTRIGEETAAGPLAIAHRAGVSELELEREAFPGEHASLLADLARAGAELIGARTDGARVRALLAGPLAPGIRPGAGPVRVQADLACVAVVGRDLSRSDLEERLLACARAHDPRARAWDAGRSLAVLVTESAAPDCVRAFHGELFGRATLCRPAAG